MQFVNNSQSKQTQTEGTSEGKRQQEHTQAKKSRGKKCSKRMEDEKGGERGANYRFALATRSISSFFLMAKEFWLSLAALINSSARHSAMVLMLRKEVLRAPVVIK